MKYPFFKDIVPVQKLIKSNDTTQEIRTQNVLL